MNALSAKERAARYVAKMEGGISGQGGHDVTFHVAAVLVHGFGLPEHDALDVFHEFNPRCTPPWSEAELIHKIKSASNARHRYPRGYLLGNSGRAQVSYDHPGLLASKTFSAFSLDPVAAAERFLKGFACDEAELFGASPVVFEGDPRMDGALMVEGLYLPGELVNFVTEYTEATEKSGEVKARPVGKGITLERDALVARFRANGSDTGKGGAWLRMNPLDGKGIADINVTAFRFALLESDKLPLAYQLSLFAQLPVPVAAILGSGGRSVHAWVKVDARNIDEYRSTVARMLGLLAKFGVDGKNKNPSRLSRLPGARREIGAAGDGIPTAAVSESESG